MTQTFIDLINLLLPYFIGLVTLLAAILVAYAGIIRQKGDFRDITKSNYIIKTSVTAILSLALLVISVGAFLDTNLVVKDKGSDTQVHTNCRGGEVLCDDSNKYETITGISKLDPELEKHDSDKSCLKWLTIPDIPCTIHKIVTEVPYKFLQSIAGFFEILTQQFNFMFRLPTDIFDGQYLNFRAVIGISELVGVMLVIFMATLQIVSNLKKSLEGEPDDNGKILFSTVLALIAVYLSTTVMEIFTKVTMVIVNGIKQGDFAIVEVLKFLFSPISENNGVILSLTMTPGLNQAVAWFYMAIILVALIVILYLFIKQAQRYFLALVMIFLAPIVAPMMFFDNFSHFAQKYWYKYFGLCIALIFQMIVVFGVLKFISLMDFSLTKIMMYLIGIYFIAKTDDFVAEFIGSVSTGSAGGFIGGVVASKVIPNPRTVVNSMRSFIRR